MKGYLYRAVIKKYWKLLLSMLLVSAFGCATMTGISSGSLSLEKSLDVYMREGGYPDAVITTDVTSRAQMDTLLSLDGIENVNARLVGDGTLIGPEGRYLSVRVMSFDEDDYQKIYIWDRAKANGLDPIYLEYFFANNNGIKAGDTVKLMSGSESRLYLVAAIISRSETLSPEVSEEISVNSTDFGFAYAHRALLEKEISPEYRDAVLEWEEKSMELTEAEQTAKQDYENALELLREAEAELHEGKTAYAANRLEMDARLKELAEKRDELEDAGTELNEKSAQLAEAEETLLEQQAALKQRQADAREQLSALEEAEKELLAGKAELEKARKEAQNKQQELRVAQAELRSKRPEVERTLSALRQAKTYLSRLGDQAGSAAKRELEGVIQEVGDQLADMGVTWNADALRSQLNSLLDSVGLGHTVSEATLNAAIGRAEDGLFQIDDGLWRINDGLRQIKEGLAEADEKEAEIDDGLRQIQEGRETLETAVSLIDESLSRIEGGQGQTEDGHAETDDPQGRIDDGLSELREAISQLYEYRRQIDEARIQLRDGQDAIESGLIQIQEGEQQIRDGLAQAEREIAEGEEELAAQRAEVENGWAEARAEFANARAELQKAADELAEWEGYQAMCNQFLLSFSPDASPDAVLAAAKDALKEANVRSAFLFRDSPVQRRIDDNLIPMQTMAGFVPVVFFGISMIVVYLFMALMIRQCRREIGILRALGFTRFSVLCLFLGVGLLVSIGAVALGLVISLAVRQCLCAYFFDLLFHLPIKMYVFNTPRILLSAALTVAVVLLSTFVSASVISSVQPSEAMTRPVSASVRIPRFLQWALRLASPFTKFSIISLLRNKLRFLFSAFCMAGSVTLIFVSFSLVSSCDEIISQVFDRCTRYDCQVFISADGDEALRGELSALPYISAVEAMDYYTAEISFRGKTEKTTVVAMEEQTELMLVEDQKMKPIPLRGNGVLLEKHLAEKLGAGIDDLVSVNGVSLPVTGISQQNGSRFQYVTRETASALTGQKLHSLIFRIPAENENELMQFLMGRENVLYAYFTRSARSAYETRLSGMKIVSGVLIAIAMMIGLVIVVNTSQTNLLEQKKELCVLRTLGFQHGEISRYWFFQSILHFLVSCAFGFPAGVELAKYTMLQLELTDRTYPFVNNPMDYAMTAAFVLGCIVMSHFYTMRDLKKWDIVEVVKEKE